MVLTFCIQIEKFFSHISKNFNTLPFCLRWLECEKTGYFSKGGDLDKYMYPLKRMVQDKIIVPYPAMSDVQGSYVAQYEHTVLLRPTCKEVLSRGWDY